MRANFHLCEFAVGTGARAAHGDVQAWEKISNLHTEKRAKIVTFPCGGPEQDPEEKLVFFNLFGTILVVYKTRNDVVSRANDHALVLAHVWR